MTAYYQLTVRVQHCVWHGSGERWELKASVPPTSVTLRAENYADAVDRAKSYLPPSRSRERYIITVDTVAELHDPISTKRIRYRGVS